MKLKYLGCKRRFSFRRGNFKWLPGSGSVTAVLNSLVLKYPQIENYQNILTFDEPPRADFVPLEVCVPQVENYLSKAVVLTLLVLSYPQIKNYAKIVCPFVYTCCTP